MMRWIVIGAGATGSYVAHALQGREQRIIVDIATTASPRASRARQTALPMNPLAPVTRVFVQQI